MSMSYDETLAFARASAEDAWDQREAFENSFESYRENLIDTMTDHGEKQWWVVRDALEIYKARFNEIVIKGGL